MVTNYENLIKENLKEFYAEIPPGIENLIPATKNGTEFHLKAFGKDCSLSPGKITLSGQKAVGPEGLLVSLYAVYANHESMKLQPFLSFKDLPGSMPYQGAFSANSERVLIPFVTKIMKKAQAITNIFDGQDGLKELSGDFSFVLFPFPKIALAYIFYLPDDEFPPSATCLFSSNALSFMPLDGLADVAEYTSKKIIEIVKGT
ncbi:DUF3786 domain-containing protein [Thermodesulfobacteriota bacterium]